MDSNQKRSLVLQPSAEMALFKPAAIRILGEIVESSLTLAKEAAPEIIPVKRNHAAIDIDPTDLADLAVIGGFHLETLTRQTGTREGEFSAWSRPMLKELGEWVNPHLRKIHAEASQLFLQAAEQGNAWAQFFVGLGYRYGEGVTKDFVEAVKWFRKAAEQGQADAQLNLAFRYVNGEGVLEDYAEAAKWFRAAADQGVASAQFFVGLAYRNGEGVVKDHAEAAKWFMKAAEQGYAHAQFSLGVCYRDGRGLERHLPHAWAWLLVAAEKGHKQAGQAADELMAVMDPIDAGAACLIAWKFKTTHPLSQKGVPL